MSYVQSMAKKNLYLNVSANVTGSSLHLVRNVSSDVNVSCFRGESVSATCSRLRHGLMYPTYPGAKAQQSPSRAWIQSYKKGAGTLATRVM